MIQNTEIFEKLHEKTSGDDVLKTFITNLLEIESEGKNYRKHYDNEINGAIKKREGQ